MLSSIIPFSSLSNPSTIVIIIIIKDLRRSLRRAPTGPARGLQSKVMMMIIMMLVMIETILIVISTLLLLLLLLLLSSLLSVVVTIILIIMIIYPHRSRRRAPTGQARSPRRSRRSALSYNIITH